jgi:phage shock protein PspC (stress-responsive transcriptional regulator)
MRSSSDRMIGGVCGGLARYFAIDLLIVRLGAVALALLGGVGLLVYAAALLLVPIDAEPATPLTTRERIVAIALAVGLTLAGLAIGGFGFAFGGALIPIAFLALAGLAVWWFVSGERPTGSAGDIVRQAAKGFALLIGCAVLAVGSFLASGPGGGVVVAALVITVGVALVAAAFKGGARWLVLPALAIALPLAFVSAAGIDLRGGFGDRREHPTSMSELSEGYRLGAGELVVDLRDLDLPPGDHPLSIDMGTGHALVLVDKNVCVASRATIGMGAASVFDRDNGGIDVDWKDTPRASRKTPRLVVDADMGLGLFEVRHRESNRHGFGPPRRFDDHSDERNSGCETRTASSGARTG